MRETSRGPRERPTPRPRVRRALGFLLFVLIPLLGVGDIAKDVYERQAFPWEAPFMVALRGGAPPLLTKVAYGVSVVGAWSATLPVVLLLAAWIWTRARASAVFVVAGVCGAALLNFLLKLFFHRERPMDVTRLWHADDASFPSGHAMTAAALAATLVALTWRTRFRGLTVVLGALYALVMGYTRVYLGAHYPTDVLAGWGLGVAWVASLALLMWPTLHRAQREADAKLD
ncbi:phosphatase PAP2 family protein [Deinococcus pimensis]|uniref:phosphatase PAP2 family protein n=1 Tax=Deinococcus pimensis TaxID=309888 RepID=UPI0004B59870|nr:phosphatase PAP2 family protein [Deinococcus pimensis]